MGLPMWRAPSPEPQHALKTDKAAPARSPIRRRRPARSPRSPRLRDRDAHALLASAQPRPSAYPPAPNVPARSHARRDGHTPGPSAEDASSARSYFRLTTDAPRGLVPREGRTMPLPYTPNFAPATASRRARGPARPHSSGPPTMFSLDLSGSFTPIDEDVISAAGFPPLRRMGRRTIADGPLPASSLRESWSPATTLDGLGDRERSMSPVVEDQWETMLTSVAPDPIAPTAESSFASAAASASFSNSHPSSRAGSSNSNSASSSRTHLTVPSRRQSWSNGSFDQFLRACDTSEDDSFSETEAEDDEPILITGASLRRSARPANDSARERSRESTREASHLQQYPLIQRALEHFRSERPHRAEEQLDRQSEERTNSDEESSMDQELRDARVLLERLTRREDIPDDFWASVGLRRPLADRVERIQERERL